MTDADALDFVTGGLSFADDALDFVTGGLSFADEALSFADAPDAVAPPAPAGMTADGRTAAEAASTEELTEFQVASRRVEQSMTLENDGEYYACVTFPSEAHRDAFFGHFGVAVDRWMVDGVALAAAASVVLPPTPPNKRFRSSKNFAALPAIRRI